MRDQKYQLDLTLKKYFDGMGKSSLPQLKEGSRCFGGVFDLSRAESSKMVTKQDTKCYAIRIIVILNIVKKSVGPSHG